MCNRCGALLFTLISDDHTGGDKAHVVMIGQTDLFAVLLLLWLVVFVCMGLDRLIRITGSRYMKLVEHTHSKATHTQQ